MSSEERPRFVRRGDELDEAKAATAGARERIDVVDAAQWRGGGMSAQRRARKARGVSSL